MAINNTDLNLQNMGNTGIETLGINLEKIVGVMFAPSSLTFTAANIATDAALITALQAAVLAAKTSRIFPLLTADGIVASTDNTAEAAVEESDYGNMMGVTYKKHNYTFRIGNNGMYLNQQLYKYVGNKNLSVFLLDGTGKLLARKSGTGMKGMPCQLVVDQHKLAGGATASVQNIKVILTETDALMDNDKLLVFPFANTVELQDLIHGLHDVVLTAGTSTQTASAIYLKALVPASYVDFGTTYKTEIEADDASAWLVYDVTAPTTPITVSGVTVVAGEIILASAAAFTSGHSFYVSLNTPAALAAAATPIGSAATGGFESNVVTIAIP